MQEARREGQWGKGEERGERGMDRDGRIEVKLGLNELERGMVFVEEGAKMMPDPRP